MNRGTLPVAVIGAGPIGLAAASHLVTRGETPLVLEAGPAAGASVLKWGHVRLFTPWRYLVDAAAASLLRRSGWETPAPESLPTGRELVEGYLTPLAALPQLQPHIRLHSRVTAVTRKGFDKMKTAGREDAPFEVTVCVGGREQRLLARAVIDASGTYERPNPLGSGGVAAAGERELAARILYGIPDVLGAQRQRYAGRRVLVVGSGHSAFNALLDLAELAQGAPGTEIIWAVRRTRVDTLFGGEKGDALPARGELGLRLRRLVQEEAVRLVTGFQIESLAAAKGHVTVAAERQTLTGIDEIIATTGFRPDLSLTGELRLALDPIVESTPALAPLIDPNVHSCGTVPPHGAEELKHPEKDVYTVGMKSYGRAPTFLMLTGYEQVRSVVSAISGDVEDARAVQLELPETGVCSSGIGGSSCCEPAGAYGTEFQALPLLEVKG